MNIIIGADFVPTKSNEEQFKTGKAKVLFGRELQTILREADFRVFNLECPLTDVSGPIPKKGKHLSAPEDCVEGYRAAGTDLLTLSNNHILDHGAEGLAHTMQVLDNAGIAYIGAGEMSEIAAKPYTVQIDGKTIGIYACAEHEFSIVGTGESTPSGERPGANPFDPLESPDHVADLADACDYVIVLYHGGKEYYRYPTPELRKTCRKLVEKGADLVVCQHSHCVGSKEAWTQKHKTKTGKGTIVYGQGNFLFDGSEKEEWQTGLLVRVKNDFNVDYIPLVKTGSAVRLADGDDALKILRGFEARSYDIRQPGFVEMRYSKFAKENYKTYEKVIAGRESLLFRIINRLTGYRLRKIINKRRYGKTELLALKNFIECEAHRELFLRGLDEKIRQS